MPVNCQKRLEVRNLTFINNEGIRILDDVNFDAFSGEILGIAGIAGSGQRELLESIAGLQIPIAGASIEYYPPEKSQIEEFEQESEEENVGKMPVGEQLIGKSPLQIREMGIRLSFVPEDRLGMGLVGNMDIIDNMMLRSYRKGHSIFLDRREPENLAEKIIKSLEVSTPSAKTPVRRLSGGNVQKVLVGREIAASPTVLLAAYPVRGLDINSSYTIYNLLTEQKKKGVCVIFVGEDLDVLLELCDRIMVIGSGRITGILDGRTAKKEEIGLLMVKNQREEQEDYEE